MNYIIILALTHVCCCCCCYCCFSPELSELHNQAALLLLFGHQHDAAAKHASDALEITQKAFGPTHPLTGHRLLRLGTIRYADEPPAAVVKQQQQQQ
jgi:hypothetical protein